MLLDGTMLPFRSVNQIVVLLDRKPAKTPILSLRISLHLDSGHLLPNHPSSRLGPGAYLEPALIWRAEMKEIPCVQMLTIFLGIPAWAPKCGFF